MITRQRIEAAYNELINDPFLDSNWYYGFLEASLISVGFIKDYNNNALGKPQIKRIKKWWGIKEIKEDRRDIIIRLTKEYLNL